MKIHGWSPFCFAYLFLRSEWELLVGWPELIFQDYRLSPSEIVGLVDAYLSPFKPRPEESRKTYHLSEFFCLSPKL